jgi:hypothetical protein
MRSGGGPAEKRSRYKGTGSGGTEESLPNRATPVNRGRCPVGEASPEVDKRARGFESQLLPRGDQRRALAGGGWGALQPSDVETSRFNGLEEPYHIRDSSTVSDRLPYDNPRRLPSKKSKYRQGRLPRKYGPRRDALRGVKKD